MSKVIIDSALRLWCLDRDQSPHELEVATGDSSRSIDTYYILVKLTDLNYNACLVHLLRCGPVWF